VTRLAQHAPIRDTRLMNDLQHALGRNRATPFLAGIRVVLGVLLLLILATLLGGIVAVAWQLRRLLTEDAVLVLRHVLIGILILLAVVEVLKTSLAYLTQGRVKVTFIVDTILVVMLTEIIALWLRGGDWKAFALLLGVIGALGGVRVLAVRFSPSVPQDTGDTTAADHEG
jgi:uncharacterized membrane protein (DUF373 family)